MLGLNPQKYTCLNSLISVVEGCVYDLLNHIISAHTISLLLKSTVGNWFAASSRLCCWILCSWITRENPLSSICSIECCFLYYLLPESVFSRGKTQQRNDIFRISIPSNLISVTAHFRWSCFFSGFKPYFLSGVAALGYIPILEARAQCSLGPHIPINAARPRWKPKLVPVWV